jgi:hypothetical protein
VLNNKEGQKCNLLGISQPNCNLPLKNINDGGKDLYWVSMAIMMASQIRKKRTKKEDGKAWGFYDGFYWLWKLKGDREIDII